MKAFTFNLTIKFESLTFQYLSEDYILPFELLFSLKLLLELFIHQRWSTNPNLLDVFTSLNHLVQVPSAWRVLHIQLEVFRTALGDQLH